MLKNVIVVVAVIAVSLLIDGAILTLTKILPRANPTPVKLQRFEAGNPPIGVPKYTLPMQYMGFMFMFMAAEPALVILLLISASPTFDGTILLALILILLLPAVYVSYRMAEKIALIGGNHG